ncbi:hypothetical protein Taro_029132 [Colocasia esculenta]|uniref:EF-hand domain-containing protein n=1 Tax=Colocasia esculenta TaxID=4460 RepID=A0A843VJ35_COLES|nr:hypothetical protein [Colocasia esculenta]
MEAYGRYHSQSYAPSAPPLTPEKQQQQQQHYAPSSGEQKKDKPGFSSSSSPASGYAYAYSQPSAPPPPTSSSSAPAPYGYGGYPGAGAGAGAYFPPGTHPWIIQSFQAVDRDRSGSIDETELQTALSSGYQKFSLRTIRLLMFLFKNPSSPSKMGPMEFAAVWECLGQWRAVFERFDRDRSGEIDSTELRDALYSSGYAVPDSVIQVLMSKYKGGSDRRGALNFDSFVECGMIVKGLTEKFKEKDTRYTGSATLSYDTFMSMIIPFLVS